MILWGFLPWSASALAARYHVVLSWGGLTNMWWLWWTATVGVATFFSASLNLMDNMVALLPKQSCWLVTIRWPLIEPLQSNPESIPDLSHTILKVLAGAIRWLASSGCVGHITEFFWCWLGFSFHHRKIITQKWILEPSLSKSCSQDRWWNEPKGRLSF